MCLKEYLDKIHNNNERDKEKKLVTSRITWEVMRERKKIRRERYHMYGLFGLYTRVKPLQSPNCGFLTSTFAKCPFLK